MRASCRNLRLSSNPDTTASDRTTLNFTLLSPLTFAAGLFALAGGLYLLQRLRVRHREVDVVTTLFWREAVHETRARMLVQRFRHPWAYVLILAIASLMWTAFAAPESSGTPERHYVFLLDSSAAMGHNQRFEEAKKKLLEVIEEAPKGAREVIACSAELESLLIPGEESLLLEARLEGLEPVAAPGSVERALATLKARSNTRTSVLIFGDTKVEEVLPGPDLDVMSVEYVFSRGGESSRASNSGITALGAAAAESGQWGAVDVLVEVRSNQAESSTPSLSLDGAVLEQEVTRRELEGGVTQYTLLDVPARGGKFEVRLSGGDSLAFDDAAALRLPDWPLLRVQLSPALDDSLRVALESDPAVVLVASNADLVVRRSDEALGAGLPALVFAPAAQQQESFLVQYVADREAELVITDAVGDLALGEIDATSLAEAADQPITIGAKRGTVREVAVWNELIGDGFDFVDSRAFPLFVSGSLRWLAQSESLQPWVAAGETRVATASLTRSAGEVVRPVGASAVPSVAGEYTTEDGSQMAVSLLSPAVTLAQFNGGLLSPFEEVSAGGFDLVTWLLIIAALLLLFEWRQVRLGRMP